MFMVEAQIGIIGGTGIYSESMLKNVKKLDVSTPYGKPSSNIILGTCRGVRVAFIFRHGEKHTIPPHKVNYRANIEALKKLGVERIIGMTAVGSLKEDMEPGDIVIPDQFIDMTKMRSTTFYDGPKVVHVSLADPFCSEMRTAAMNVLKELKLRHHAEGTYICIDGPRFSSRAESNAWRVLKADIIGMTLVPEVTLAREKEICYLTIATVTDYDCWKEGAVSAEEVIKAMHKSTENVKKVLEKIVTKFPKERKCICKSALKGAEI